MILSWKSFLLFLSVFIPCMAVSQHMMKTNVPIQSETSAVTNPIFQDGEELTYEVSWLGINAGLITIKLQVGQTYNDQPVFLGTVIGETTNGFSRFFKVRDVIESSFDPVTFNSIYYKKSIREGKYRKEKETWYDQKNGLAITKDRSYSIPPDSKDPIACIFELRKNTLEPGRIINMNANADGKDSYPIRVEVVARELVTIPSGTHIALVCKPLPTWEGRVFEKNRSEVDLWVSDDEYLVPLKIHTKVKIGSLKAVLVTRKGPGWNITREKDDL